MSKRSTAGLYRNPAIPLVSALLLVFATSGHAATVSIDGGDQSIGNASANGAGTIDAGGSNVTYDWEMTFSGLTASDHGQLNSVDSGGGLAVNLQLNSGAASSITGTWTLSFASPVNDLLIDNLTQPVISDRVDWTVSWVGSSSPATLTNTGTAEGLYDAPTSTLLADGPFASGDSFRLDNNATPDEQTGTVGTTYPYGDWEIALPDGITELTITASVDDLSGIGGDPLINEWIVIDFTSVVQPITHSFSTATDGAGTGDTTGSTADGSYADGTTITLVANAGAGSVFDGWSPAGCVDGFGLTADTVCTATFTLDTPAPVDVTALTEPSDGSGGTVECLPNPVSYNGEVTCTATPAKGYVFDGFTGDCTGNTCVINNVTAALSITANFRREPATTAAQPIPVLDLWGLAGLSGLIGLLAWRRRTQR